MNGGKQPPSDPPTPPRGFRTRPVRNGGGDRVDDLAEAIETLTALTHKCIAAAESARNSSDTAVVASRDSAHKIGMLLRDTALIRADQKKSAELLKRIADRVVSLEERGSTTDQRISKAEIDAALAKQTAEDTQKRPAVTIVNDFPTIPPAKIETEPPPAIRPFVSKQFYKKHKFAFAMLLALAMAAWGVIQSFLTKGHQP